MPPLNKNRCTRCKITFEHNNIYMEHFMKCELKFQQKLTPKISCQKCNKKFNYKKTYLHHLENYHCELPTSIPCEICPARCPNKTVLQEHIKIHLRKQFNCPICKTYFARKAHVDRHLQQSSCSGAQTKKPFLCDICNAAFGRKDNLINHLRTQHISNVRSYVCKLCSETFKSFSRLVTHTQRQHWNNLPFECDICGKSTSSKTALVKHMEIHGNKRFSCEVCGFTSYTPEVLRRHILTHVPDKPFKCVYCPKSFIQMLQLRNHIAKHEVRFPCSSCDEAFESHAALSVHNYEHEGKDKTLCYAEGCPQAGIKFRNEKALEKHLKYHEANYVHRCDVCGKVFQSAAYARRHVMTHTLERPRRCMYCVSPRAYVRGVALVRHVRRTHPSVFRSHLLHVRNVLVPDTGIPVRESRIRRSEMDAIISVMDAETERVIAASGGPGTLYAGMAQEEEEAPAPDSSNDLYTWQKFEEDEEEEEVSMEDSSVEELKPLLSMEELADSLRQLLVHLVDSDTLENLGWPDDSVDDVLERVIEQCGAQPAERHRYSRVQRLRENAKHLFLNVVEDKTVANMLATHTIDQIIRYVLNQVANCDVL